MTQIQSLAMPWAPTVRTYCAPKRVVVKLALGEAPDNAPNRMSVRRGLAQGLSETGHGAVDRVLRDFGGAARLALIHEPANARSFDMEEHATGASRTFVALCQDACRIDELTDALLQTHVVEAATPDYFIQQLDAVPTTPDYLDDPLAPWDQIGADAAMRRETGDVGVLAAVLDTGAAQQHDELSGRLSHGFDAVNFGQRDVAQGLLLVGDYAGRDTDPSETANPHGTACLAIIGGRGRRMPAGLAGAARLMPVRVLASAKMPGQQAQVIGLGALSDIDYAMKRCVDLGARVLNCSFGTGASALRPGDATPHQDMTSYAQARGAVVIAASGNSGDDEVYYPAALPNVIAVGSVDRADRPSAFSTRGAHVALSAPGERILTPAIRGYQRVTGTSFAAPFVAGVAALAIARANRAARPLSGGTLRTLMSSAARPFSVPAQGHGAGVLDAPATLEAVDQWIAASTEPDWEPASRSPTPPNARTDPAGPAPVPSRS